LNIAHKSNMQK